MVSAYLDPPPSCQKLAPRLLISRLLHSLAQCLCSFGFDDRFCRFLNVFIFFILLNVLKTFFSFLKLFFLQLFYIYG